MELPKKGDFYSTDEGQPLLIMEVTTLGRLGVVICVDPKTRGREIGKWGDLGNDGYFHLVKDHRGYWTRQQREGKCPIFKHIAKEAN